MKILYKALKITGIITLSIVIFMIITVVLAKIFEDKLASFTIMKLEKKINAPLSVGKVSLIPLFSFPHISAEIHKLYIGDPLGRDNDTIFFINSLKVGLNSWDLIAGVYTIDKMEISGLDFEYTIDKRGKSNIDFILNALVDTTAVRNNKNSTPLDLNAEKLTLENINIVYYDSLNSIASQVRIPEIIITARTKNNIFVGNANGSFVLTNCLLPETKLNQMKSCSVIFDIKYDNNEAKIEELSIISEGILLGVVGNVNNNNGLAINTSIEAREMDFNILKKYVPNQYTHIFENTNFTKRDYIDIDLDMHYIDDNVSFNKFSLHSEGVDLGIVGKLGFRDTISINTNIETLNLNFDVLKRYIPTQYFQEYGVIDIGGILDVNAQITGIYADSTKLPLVVADVNLDNIRVQTVDYPKINALNLTAHISNGEKADLSEGSIDISKLNIVSPGSYIQVEGNVLGFENPQYQLSSNLELNLIEVGSMLPDNQIQNLQGSIIASIKTSGKLPNNITNDYLDNVMNNSTLSVSARDVSALISDSMQLDDFSVNINYLPQDSGVKKVQVNNLNLKSTNLNLDIQNTSLSALVTGNISNPQQLGVNLQSFNVKSGNSQILGMGEVTNFETPVFTVNTNIILKLDELLTYMPDSIIENMSGFVKADIQSNGQLDFDSLDVQLLPILFENSSIGLSLNSISLAFPDSLLNVDNISGRIALKNDILTVDDFSAKYNGLVLEMDSTRVHNIYDAVLLNKQEELFVDTHIKIGDIFFDDFKHLMATGSQNTNSDTMTKPASDESGTTLDNRNWTYLIHGSASIESLIIDSLELEEFNINRLHINDVSSLFKISDSSYIVDQFKLKVFEGEVNNSLNFKLRKDGRHTLSTHNVIDKINIQTMMMDMDNFGLDSVITHENISGLFSTDLNTFVPIDDSVLINKLLVSGDIVIERGGVYNFAPASEISKFTSIKELDNIQFKTLRSNVFMFKNKLYVPRTNIVSNALDIAAFGMQDLGGGSEYHLELHLSNILFGKSKRRNKKQDSRGEEVDEESLKKSSQKIRYSVTQRKSKVGRDSKDSREEMMNKIRVQKKMLDFIFFPKNIHYNTELNN